MAFYILLKINAGCGLVSAKIGKPLCFAEGTVRALWHSLRMDSPDLNTRNLTEIARYEYDAWGNANVQMFNSSDSRVQAQINNVHIGSINPIRWKSQYFDEESQFYYINGRYYNPVIKQYLSPLPPEIMLGRTSAIYGLNPYLLCLTNPVNMVYNGHTIETAMPFAFDTPIMTRWERFWGNVGRFFGRAFSWWDDLPNLAKWLIGAVLLAGMIVAAAVTGGMSLKLKAKASAVVAKTAAITKVASVTKGMALGAGLSGGFGSLFGGIQGGRDGAASGFAMGAISGAITGGLGGAGLSPLRLGVASAGVTGTLGLATRGPIALTDLTFYLGMVASFGGGAFGGWLGGKLGKGVKGALIGLGIDIAITSAEEGLSFIPSGTQNTGNNIHLFLMYRRLGLV